MYKIELSQVPNQQVKFNIDKELYCVDIRTTDNATFITISRNEVVLISGQLLLTNTPIIEYSYLISKGNFILYSNTPYELTDYRKFNESQVLYYVSKEEIAEAQSNG